MKDYQRSEFNFVVMAFRYERDVLPDGSVAAL